MNRNKVRNKNSSNALVDISNLGIFNTRENSSRLSYIFFLLSMYRCGCDEMASRANTEQAISNSQKYLIDLTAVTTRSIDCHVVLRQRSGLVTANAGRGPRSTLLVTGVATPEMHMLFSHYDLKIPV